MGSISPLLCSISIDQNMDNKDGRPETAKGLVHAWVGQIVTFSRIVPLAALGLPNAYPAREGH